MSPDIRRAAEGVGVRTDALAARVRLRRALALLLMTLALPGSAQLAAGNRRIGQLALRVVCASVLTVALLVVVALSSRETAFSIATDTTFLTALQLVLVVLALGWIALFVDAWRLGAPPALRQRQRLAMVAVGTSLCLVTAGVLLGGARVVTVQRDLIATVFHATTVSESEGGRYNVLLLGGDSGDDRWGLRPDSITIASVDDQTGRTLLISLPRNLENVPFPEGSPMHDEYPKGYTCEGCYLNGVYTWGLDHEDEMGDVRNGRDAGTQATIEAVEEITDLKINYYAMINMEGFQSLIDAVGGVTLDLPTDIPIGKIGDVTDVIPAGKDQHLTGYEALWFARSRAYDSDYARMGRQKCVLSAMLQQLSPQRVLTNVQEIADSSEELLSTDVPARELDTFLDLALDARSQPVASLSLVPPKVNTSDPDYDEIREMVAEAIARVEGDAPPAADRPRRAAPPADPSNPPANQTGDVATAC